MSCWDQLFKLNTIGANPCHMLIILRSQPSHQAPNIYSEDCAYILVPTICRKHHKTRKLQLVWHTYGSDKVVRIYIGLWTNWHAQATANNHNKFISPSFCWQLCNELLPVSVKLSRCFAWLITRVHWVSRGLLRLFLVPSIMLLAWSKVTKNAETTKKS